MMRSTKIVLAASVVFVLLVVGFFSFRQRTVLRNLPVHRASPEQVMSRQALFPTLTPDGRSVLFYSEEDSGRIGFFQVDATTHIEERFWPTPRIIDVLWSPDRAKALIALIYNEERLGSTAFRSSAYEGAVTVWVFELATEQVAQLPLGTVSAAWDDRSEKIFYYYLDLSSETPVSDFSVREAFGTSFTKLADVPPAVSYTIEVLSERTVVLVPNVSDPEGITTIYFFDIETRTLSAVAEEKVKTASSAPGGAYLLYHRAEGEGVWHLITVATQKDTDLSLPATQQYADWIDENRFLVVQLELTGTQTIWLIDAANLTRQELQLTVTQPLSVDRILPVQAGAVYFTSGNFLYRIRLPQ